MKALAAKPNRSGVSTQFVIAKVPILRGKCQLYTRPNSKYWWAVFYHKRKAICSSTKHTDVGKAELVAEKWYYEKQGDIERGEVIVPATRKKSFAYAADKAYAEYHAEMGKRKGRSKTYVLSLKKTLDKLKRLSIAKVEISAVNHQTWEIAKTELLMGNPELRDRTLHQYRNAIQVVLKQAYKRDDIKQLPDFIPESTGASDDTPRTFFDHREFDALIKAIEKHIVKKMKEKNGWTEGARELLDYVIIVANTGIRSGPNSEAMNVRFCDVTVEGKGTNEYLEIRNIMGKRSRDGFGRCTSFSGEAPEAFKRCIKRHGLTLTNYAKSDERIFKEYHRDMFKTILDDAKLYHTNDRVKRKRDLMSLRNTYICFALDADIDVWDIAKNCRTSVEMIQRHYARHQQPDPKKFNKKRTADVDLDAQ
jgi:hypothetical protein